MQRFSCCWNCLAFLLKFLNFLQTFVGVSALLYGVWLINLWHKNGSPVDLDYLPAPWFVCSLMGVGILVCLFAFIGHVATEVASGCCLCFYAVLSATLITLEAALVGDVMLNKHWEQDLPYDSTRELQRFRSFIEDNMDLCKWVAASFVVIQALSLILAIVLRAIVPKRRVNYDSDEDFVVLRRPLLTPQSGSPAYVAPSYDNKGYHSDIWSSRIRQKYGLNQSESSYAAHPTAAT